MSELKAVVAFTKNMPRSKPEQPQASSIMPGAPLPSKPRSTVTKTSKDSEITTLQPRQLLIRQHLPHHSKSRCSNNINSLNNLNLLHHNIVGKRRELKTLHQVCNWIYFFQIKIEKKNLEFFSLNIFKKDQNNPLTPILCLQ